MSAEKGDSRLAVHIVHRLDYGGLENGLVNVINGLSDSPLRHIVIALTEATGFSKRLRDDVVVKSIGKKSGKDFGAYWRLYRVLRRLGPDIVHTRNFGTLDCAFIAFLARVPIRIHGEHGRDVIDPDGKNRRHLFVRRILSRLISQFVAVSRELRDWLITDVGVPAAKVKQICNGVDVGRFRPREGVAQAGDPVIGSVTRFSDIKDPMNLVQAFVSLKRDHCPGRLLMVGDGELREPARDVLERAQFLHCSSLPGARDDIADQLRSMDVFVLGSLREGISNTILEAMATGLPIVASRTGGNSELVLDGVNGTLVPPGDWRALAAAIGDYVKDPDLRSRHGAASRERAVSSFSIHRMIEEYRSMYETALAVPGN